MTDDSARRLVHGIRNLAKPQKTQRVATITNVTKNEMGLAVSAIATIGRETNVTVKLAQGIGTVTHVGETWLAELEGGATGVWRLVECQQSRYLRIADQTDTTLPTPQIPTPEYGGLYTESAQAGTGTPNANPDPQTAQAVAYLYYWSILPGSYSVFDQGIKQVVYQTRESSFEEWDRTSSADLYPNRKVELPLAGAVTASGTALPVTVDSSLSGFLLEGQPAYWRVRNEVILGIYEPGGTIRVVAHNGSGSAVRGQGFVASSAGRGQPQGGAASDHPAGEVVELLTGQVAIPMLRPGSDYEVHLAFANHASRPGPWSAVQSFEAWSQDIAPIAPQDMQVEQFSHAINATWTRVTADVEGNPRSDIRRYAVARHTAALAATATFAAVAAVATIIAGTAYPISNTSAQIPSTQGYGNYIGVAAISDQGLLGSWSWEQDNVAPPYPDPSEVTFTSVPRGVLVNIPAGADSRDPITGGTILYGAHLDPGFKEFWLWQANDSAGSAAAVVSTFSALTQTWQQTSGLTGWFKVTAADGAGNSSGPATYPANTPRAGQANTNTANWTSGWQFSASLYAETGILENGNFQDPNSTNTNARFWSGTAEPFIGLGGTISGSVNSILYASTGGIEGNRAYKFNVASTGLEPTYDSIVPTLYYSLSNVIPAHDTEVTLTMWVHSSAAMYVNLVGRLFTYSDDAGANFLGEIVVSTSAPVAIPANTWTKISTVYSGVVQGTYATARTARFKFQVWREPTVDYGVPLTYDIYFDAVRLEFE